MKGSLFAVTTLFLAVAVPGTILAVSLCGTTHADKAEEIPGFFGWYVLEEPIPVTHSIWKYKISRGPHEPMIEAFASSGRVDTVGVPGSSEYYPRAIVWYEVKAAAAIFSPSGNPFPVNFLQPKLK